MPVPMALAAPAAVAGMAYLNAKFSLWYDHLMFKAIFTATAAVSRGERSKQLNMFYVLENQAKTKGKVDQDLLLFEGQRYSYGQVYDNALRYGNYLKSKFDIRPGDIVAMDFENSDIFIFVWLGLWSIGAKPAFLNYNLTGAPLAHCIKISNTKICLVDPSVAKNVGDDVQKPNPNVRFVVWSSATNSEAAQMQPVRSPDSDRADANRADMAILIYTSGTTGLPKPAIVSWGKCYVGSHCAKAVTGRRPTDIMYTSMPLYHSSAALLSFLSNIITGCTQALGRRFSTKLFWPEVRESNATVIQYVGETLRYLLAAPPQVDPVTGENLDRQHKVRCAFGNGLRPDIWNKFKDRFGVETIAEFYSATEGTIGTWNQSSNDDTAGAIGKHGFLFNALLSTTAAVIELDPNTDEVRRDSKSGYCKAVKSGEPGELISKLPTGENQKFQGYYGNSKATESKILRNVFRKGDAWFRSGDLLRWDSDGRVYFHDRIGDTFRWKSENVSTAEVSEAVGRHPAIREANVYGVELPHHDGRAGCAAISMPGGADAETMRSLAAHVRKTLPRYAQPIFLRLSKQVGGGPYTTGTNKQQKHLLRQAGVKPSEKDGEMGALWWLHGETYVPFIESDWRELEGGRVKL